MDSISSIKDTLKQESDIIAQLINDLDLEKLNKVINLIVNCKGKVIVSGCGTSGAAAQKVAHTLCCIECPATFLLPSNALHGGLGLIQKNDIVILLSKGGNTSEINAIVPRSKIKGAFTIGVTENESSFIANQSDLFLKINVKKEPDDFNMLATGSTLATIAIFDAIAIAVMRQKHYSKEQFLLIHPGGDVGKRLSMTDNSIEGGQE